MPETTMHWIANASHSTRNVRAQQNKYNNFQLSQLFWNSCFVLLSIFVLSLIVRTYIFSCVTVCECVNWFLFVRFSSFQLLLLLYSIHFIYILCDAGERETLQHSCGIAIQIQLLIRANGSEEQTNESRTNMALMLINDVNGWQFCFDKLIFCCRCHSRTNITCPPSGYIALCWVFRISATFQ